MVLGFYYYYYYFKIHFPFLSSPACLHNPPGGPSTKRQHRWVTWRSPRFYPRYEPSLKSLTESFKNGHGLHSSERRMDCNLCHKQNTTVVIPNGEKIKDVLEKLSVWQQIRHWNRRRCSIYIGTCILQIGDGWMDFWETICSRSNSNDGCHFCKPHSFSNLYTKQHCRYFFFL